MNWVFEWLGCVPYAPAWEMQRRLAMEIAAGSRPPTVLLLEHPHTYTIGRAGGAQHILWDQEQLRKQGVEVYSVDRGGDVTYHGPGQLVGYPLIPLAQPGWQGGHLPQADYVGFLRKLEQALILALSHWKIQAEQRAGLTGVWVPGEGQSQPAKIASIGVKVDARGVSQHGFALNIQPEMAYWTGIVPCGLEGVQMCAVADFVRPAPTMQEAAKLVAASLGEIFLLENPPQVIQRDPG